MYRNLSSDTSTHTSDSLQTQYRFLLSSPFAPAILFALSGTAMMLMFPFVSGVGNIPRIQKN